MDFSLSDSCCFFRIGSFCLVTGNSIFLDNGDIFYGFTAICFGDFCLNIGGDLTLDESYDLMQ